MKIEVGQKCCIIPTGNAARYDSKPFEAEISKVGRKYFHVKRIGHDYDLGRFGKDDFIHDNGDYSSQYIFKWSFEQITREYEANEIWDRLRRKYFGGYKNPGIDKDILIRVEEALTHINPPEPVAPKD